VNVSFHPLAERELNDAAQYYESNGAGLGAAFLTEVQRCCDGIVEYPGAGLVMTGSVRRRLIRRFTRSCTHTTVCYAARGVRRSRINNSAAVQKNTRTNRRDPRNFGTVVTAVATNKGMKTIVIA
jgi:plasmid stabilization system protein ParE